MASFLTAFAVDRRGRENCRLENHFSEEETVVKCKACWHWLAMMVMVAGSACGEEPIVPQEPMALFNGHDLTGWRAWLKESGYEDPKQVFRVEDGQLHITGDGLGYLATAKTYADFELIVEFRWGEKTWGSRREATRDSGVLVYANGEDGSALENWMPSLEVQLIEGGTGDFIVINGKRPDGSPTEVAIVSEVARDRDGEAIWKAGGKAEKFTAGRVNWYGRDPDWEDKIGFRGKEDVESPLGEWTTVRTVCDGPHVQVFVNDRLVNEAKQVTPTSGKILIQTEMAELFVRKVELRPLSAKSKAKR